MEKPALTSTPALQISGVTKRYAGNAEPAVNDLTLNVEAGIVFGLLGPNGAGKTSLLSMVCGLLAPDAGRIAVFGHDVAVEPQAVRRTFGLVPQELALYPHLNARENLAFFGHMQGLRGAHLRSRIDACLAIAGLREFAQRRVTNYSGGLKRRLNLAIGLIHEPRLLILDEPTVGIDPQSRHFIHATLARLNAEGMTIVYTTHYMEEVEQLCTEVAIVDHGRIVTHGALADLLRASAEIVEVHTQHALPDNFVRALTAHPVLQHHTIDERHVRIHSTTPAVAMSALLSLLQEHRVAIGAAHLGASDLEEVFLRLTGTRLRD